LPRASGLEAELKNNFSNAEITLTAGSGGIYEIRLAGEEIFSRRQAGRFPEAAEIIRLIRDRQ